MPFVMQKRPEQQSFDGAVWPAGQHEFLLDRIEAGMYQQFKQDGTRAEPYPHFRFVYKDAEGDTFQTQPIRFPKGFQYNDKAGFWKHVGALFGRALTEEDTEAVEIDLGPEYDSWESVTDPDNMPNLFAKKEEPRPIVVKSIKVHGKEIVKPESKIYLVLTTEIKKNQDGTPKTDNEGNQVEYNKIQAVLPGLRMAEPRRKNCRSKVAQSPRGSYLWGMLPREL